MSLRSGWLPVVSVAVFAAGLAGCIGQVAGDSAYLVEGTFVENRTDEQREAFSQLVEGHDGEAIVFTSLPASFRVRDLTEDACETVHASLLASDDVADVTDCIAYDPTDAPGKG